MNDDLQMLIEKFRRALEEKENGPVIGEIPLGNAQANCELASWREFLRTCNGGRFGAIDLWSAEELPDYQNTWLSTERRSDYVVIGQVLYEPIVMERATELLFWDQGTEPFVALGTADHFLSHFVFGPGYGEIIPDVESEPWWQFCLSMGQK